MSASISACLANSSDGIGSPCAVAQEASARWRMRISSLLRYRGVDVFSSIISSQVAEGFAVVLEGALGDMFNKGTGRDVPASSAGFDLLIPTEEFHTFTISKVIGSCERSRKRGLDGNISSRPRYGHKGWCGLAVGAVLLYCRDMRFLKIIATIASVFLVLATLYMCGVGLFMRIMFADGFYWHTPPVPVPAWYYIPEHVVMDLPWLLLSALPLLLIHRHSVAAFFKSPGRPAQT